VKSRPSDLNETSAINCGTPVVQIFEITKKPEFRGDF
jgi:hypothetical protein